MSIRLFFSIPLPEDIAQQISAISEMLDPLEWKIVPKENLHITLAFIGNVEEESISSMISALDISDIPPFSMEFEKVIVKSKGHEGMIWYQGMYNDYFNKLSQRIYKSLKIPQDHPPNPHITLARKRKYKNTDLKGKLRDLPKLIPVSSFFLMQSFTLSSGAKYVPRHKFELRIKDQ